MTMTAIVTFHARNGLERRLQAMLLENFGNLQKSVGFIDNTVYRDTSDSQIFVEVESWSSVDTYRAYLASLEASGVLPKFVELLTQAPTIQYLEPLPGGAIRA